MTKKNEPAISIEEALQYLRTWRHILKWNRIEKDLQFPQSTFIRVIDRGQVFPEELEHQLIEFVQKLTTV